PAGLTSFHTRVDATASVGLFVDISADLNVQTGLVTWTFTAIDPKTLDVLDPNSLAGFLPPDNSSGAGTGFVSYSVRPRSSVATGTDVQAQATVVFDTNPPLNTVQVKNRIDAGAPTSSVTALPAASASRFTVTWSGRDE